MKPLRTNVLYAGVPERKNAAARRVTSVLRQSEHSSGMVGYYQQCGYAAARLNADESLSWRFSVDQGLCFVTLTRAVFHSFPRILSGSGSRR